MNLQNKKKKLSIRVVIHPCKASAAGVYSLAIRVLYCRKKKEYSLADGGIGCNFNGYYCQE